MHKPTKASREKSGWPARLAWLLAIWAASIAVLAIVAYVLRVVMESLGMTAGSA